MDDNSSLPGDQSGGVEDTGTGKDTSGQTGGIAVVVSPFAAKPLPELRKLAREKMPELPGQLSVMARKDELVALLDGLDKGGVDADNAKAFFLTTVDTRVKANAGNGGGGKPKRKAAAKQAASQTGPGQSQATAPLANGELAAAVLATIKAFRRKGRTLSADDLAEVQVVLDIASSLLAD